VDIRDQPDPQCNHNLEWDDTVSRDAERAFERREAERAEGCRIPATIARLEKRRRRHVDGNPL